MSHYSRLTREKRYTLEVLIRKRTPQKDIAAMLEVHPSTISRELRRDGMNARTYGHRRAERHSKANQPRPGRPACVATLALAEEKLRHEQWSPEQISRHFALMETGSISHETLYRHIYRDQSAGGDLHRHLRHRLKSYRKRGQAGRERRGKLKDQKMINERPPVVEERSRVGDWEMDTVLGGNAGGPVLVTMVERRSRYTLIALAASREANEVSAAILEAMRACRDKVLTMTYDNGKEFALHWLLAGLLEADAYFAHPYHSWERGLNENTNGLIRQYFPKGTDFSRVTAAEVRAIQDKLNSRPRKCLDYRTPNDIFSPPPPIALAA